MKKRKRYKTNTCFKMAHLGLVLLIVTTFMTAMKPVPKLEEIILGTWKYEYSGRDSITLVKVQRLKPDAPGIIFKNDGTLINRQNASWCGTPPISYDNFRGTWTMTSDSTLTVSQKYWGGTVHMNWVLKNKFEQNLLFETKDVSHN